jgi:hypothetical protein
MVHASVTTAARMRCSGVQTQADGGRGVKSPQQGHMAACGTPQRPIPATPSTGGSNTRHCAAGQRQSPAAAAVDPGCLVAVRCCCSYPLAACPAPLALAVHHRRITCPGSSGISQAAACTPRPEHQPTPHAALLLLATTSHRHTRTPQASKGPARLTLSPLLPFVRLCRGLLATRGTPHTTHTSLTPGPARACQGTAFSPPCSEWYTARCLLPLPLRRRHVRSTHWFTPGAGARGLAHPRALTSHLAIAGAAPSRTHRQARGSRLTRRASAAAGLSCCRLAGASLASPSRPFTTLHRPLLARARALCPVS